MRLGILALAVAATFSSSVMAADRVDEFEIEITTPKASSEQGVKPQTVQPVMTQATSRQKTPEELLWDRAAAQSSGMDFGTIFASGIMASFIGNDEIVKAKPVDFEAMPTIPADSSCVMPQVPEPLTVDKPQIPRFSLTANAHAYKVASGDTLAKVVAEVQKMMGGKVDGERILAAIFRENPSVFTANGLVADKILNVPSAQRIALEAPASGQAVMDAANNSKLKSYKLPALVLPWGEEDAKIQAQIAKAQQVSEIRAQARASVRACLNKEAAEREAAAKKALEQKRMAETPADIADDSFMIKDEEDSATQVTYNEQGKRVITFKNEQPVAKGREYDNANNADGPNEGMVVAEGNGIYGTSLVLGGRNGSVGLNSQGKVNPRLNGSSSSEDLKKSQAEVKRLNDEITRLRSQYEAQAQRNAEDMNELKGMMSQLLDKKGKQNSEVEDEAEDNSSYTILAIGLGILLMLAASGYLFIRLKLNKMRRALMEADESENSNCPDLDGDSVNFKEEIHFIDRGRFNQNEDEALADDEADSDHNETKPRDLNF